MSKDAMTLNRTAGLMTIQRHCNNILQKIQPEDLSPRNFGHASESIVYSWKIFKEKFDTNNGKSIADKSDLMQSAKLRKYDELAHGSLAPLNFRTIPNKSKRARQVAKSMATLSGVLPPILKPKNKLIQL